MIIQAVKVVGDKSITTLKVTFNTFRMSGLPGVDPAASTGISGDATRTQQVEPVAEKTENQVSRNSEIDHTNISMAIDVLHKQYIYTGTYTWKTTDNPGTVLALFPIHPDSCNQYTNHVYQMFNTWNGGQKARVRIIGTAFYGGGLYFVRIPPNFSAAEIERMQLAGFTAFPHTDMDPKNMKSIDMKLEDYRSLHFHTGSLDVSNPQSFAGYLAIVVNARLVTQSDAIHSIDLRVEMAGDFTFRVPIPIKEKPTQATGPLAARSLRINMLRGCDDTATLVGDTRLTICSNTQKRFYNGNVFMRNSRGAYEYLVDVNSTLATNGDSDASAVTKWKAIIADARLVNNNDDFIDKPFEQTPNWFPNPEQPSQHGIYIFDRFHVGESPIGHVSWTPINFRVGSSNGTYITCHAANDPGQQFDRVASIDFFGHANHFECDAVSKNFNQVGVPLLGTNLFNHPKAACDVDALQPFLNPNLDDPNIGSESYVSITTNCGFSASAQAYEWAEDLGEFAGQWPEGSAALYTALDKQSSVVAKIKLRSNGHMYAPASATSLLLNAVELRFEQWIPENEAIPMTTAMMNLSLREGLKHGIRAVLGPQQHADPAIDQATRERVSKYGICTSAIDIPADARR